MKLYIDKLPHCCLECQLECPEEDRCVDRTTMNCEECGGRPKSCPLQSLIEHDKQIRKQVCEDIKKFSLALPNYDGEIDVYTISTFMIDQIEKGESNAERKESKSNSRQ